jgi:GAF domain-containing protein
MTIQSDVPAAFSEEDITTLQTMADQLANAIENARLVHPAKLAEALAQRGPPGRQPVSHSVIEHAHHDLCERSAGAHLCAMEQSGRIRPATPMKK